MKGGEGFIEYTQNKGAAARPGRTDAAHVVAVRRVALAAKDVVEQVQPLFVLRRGHSGRFMPGSIGYRGLKIVACSRHLCRKVHSLPNAQQPLAKNMQQYAASPCLTGTGLVWLSRTLFTLDTLPGFCICLSSVSPNAAASLRSNKFSLLFPLLSNPLTIPNIELITTFRSLQVSARHFLNLFASWPL